MEKVSKLVAIKRYIEGPYDGFNGRKVESKELTQLSPDDRIELAKLAVERMGDCELNDYGTPAAH